MRWSMFDGDGQQVLLDARRRAMATSTPSISSRQLLAGCLGDASVRQVLTSAGIDPAAATARLGDRPPPTRADLLALIGIDAAAVARALPTSEAVPWRLRRRAIWPLRITLDGPSSSIRFAASGRKILEVALWHAKRRRRPASSLDLLRGVLSDGRDPSNECLADDELAARRLFQQLFEPHEPPT